MSANQDAEGIGDADEDAVGTADNDLTANGGDADLAAGGQAAAAAAVVHRRDAPAGRRNTRRRRGGLTARQFRDLGDDAIIRSMNRPELNPQYRIDAATLNPLTLSNEQIAAIWNPVLLNIYVQNLGYPCCPRHMRRDIRRYWIVYDLLRHQQARVRCFWALLLANQRFQALVADMRQCI